MKKKAEPGVPPIGKGEVHLAAHMFVPERLTLARELRGCTKAEVAERVSKTAAAIGQFENGRARPDAQTLASIALALGVPVGFFARQQAASLMSIDACHFRSLRSASQRERKRLLATGSLLCDVLGFLDHHVELPAEQVTAVAASVQTIEEIEICATHVRKSWGMGLGPIPNMVKLLESKGTLVAFIPNDCEEVDAFSAWHEGRPLVFLVRHKGSTSRTRFDAAHELGHLVMHADVVAGSPELERQANRFAGAFLLPRDSFLRECPRSLNWPLFHELKQRWKVSLAALVKRAHDLECISEASYRRAFVHLNQTGARRSEPHEPSAEHASLFTQAFAAIADEYSPEDVANALAMPWADVATVVGIPPALELLQQASTLAEQRSLASQAVVLAGAALEMHVRTLDAWRGVKGIGTAALSAFPQVSHAQRRSWDEADTRSITAWTQMRNSAAHHEHFTCSADEIRTMIEGIRQFIERTHVVSTKNAQTERAENTPAATGAE